MLYVFLSKSSELIIFKKIFINLIFEFQVFLNEHRNQWYSSGTYFLSKSLYELIKFFMIDYICYLIAYYGASEPDVDHWYQGFWQIPHRFLLFFSYTYIAMINMNGNLS